MYTLHSVVRESTLQAISLKHIDVKQQKQITKCKSESTHAVLWFDLYWNVNLNKLQQYLILIIKALFALNWPFCRIFKSTEEK